MIDISPGLLAIPLWTFCVYLFLENKKALKTLDEIKEPKGVEATIIYLCQTIRKKSDIASLGKDLVELLESQSPRNRREIVEILWRTFLPNLPFVLSFLATISMALVLFQIDTPYVSIEIALPLQLAFLLLLSFMANKLYVDKTVKRRERISEIIGRIENKQKTRKRGEPSGKNEDLDIYVINIPKVRSEWIKKPSDVRIAVEEVMAGIGRKVFSTASMEELDDLVRNPPDNAIVINGHGEAMPMPSSWEDDWQSYFKTLARNIRDHGWCFTSITGYPFFYYVKEHEERHQCAENGLNAVLSIVGARANCWHGVNGDLTVSLTEEGRNAADKTALKSTLKFPEETTMCRVAEWIRVDPIKMFYSRGALCGASAIPIGKGFFIQNGMMCEDMGLKTANLNSDRTFGQMTLAFALAMEEL